MAPPSDATKRWMEPSKTSFGRDVNSMDGGQHFLHRTIQTADSRQVILQWPGTRILALPFSRSLDRSLSPSHIRSSGINRRSSGRPLLNNHPPFTAVCGSMKAGRPSFRDVLLGVRGSFVALRNPERNDENPDPEE